MVPQKRIEVGIYRDGLCWLCGHLFTSGVGILDATGEPVASLCLWCLCGTLDTLTGHGYTEQTLNWNAAKDWSRKRKEPT